MRCCCKGGRWYNGFEFSQHHHKASILSIDTKSSEKLVDIGHWLYGGSARCIVHLVHRNVAYGSGDYQDPIDIRDDRAGKFYYLKFFDPDNPENVISRSGAFDSETLAREAASEMCPDLKWTV